MAKDIKDVFNYYVLKDLRFVGQFELPLISKVDSIPKNLISFNYVSSMLKKKDFNPEDYFVHFFIDDYQFERVWNSPDRYYEQLSKFKGIIMPDFSVYQNFPKALQIYNVFKSRVIAAYYASKGMTVIPNVTWSDYDSLEWILEGLPKHSVIALSSNGVLNKNVLDDFIYTFNEIVRRLEPTKIVFVGSVPKELKSDKRIIQFESHLQLMKKEI